MTTKAVKNYVVVAYVPVIHRGYLDFFTQHSEADVLYVIDAKLVAETDYLRKEIRALSPEEAVQALAGLAKRFSLPKIEIASKATLKNLNKAKTKIVTPQDDQVVPLLEKYAPNCKLEIKSVFLRWDRKSSKVNKEVEVETIELDSLAKTHPLRAAFAAAQEEKAKSSDWWRQIGSALFSEKSEKNESGELLLQSHNHHLPSAHRPYIDGDPRNAFHRGENLDLYTSVHAEADLIAQAARRGIALEGLSFFATTFPCPVCAKQIAQAGIGKLYFHEGYAMLDGQSVMEDAGVEIIRVV